MRTKFYIEIESPEHSVEVQKALFKLGYEWNGGDKDIYSYAYHTITVGYLKNYPIKMTYGEYDDNMLDFDKLTLEDLWQMTKENSTMKVEDLKVGETYTVQHSGQFCHAYNYNGSYRLNEMIKAIFVGIINVKGGERAIFYSVENGTYLMFATEELDYIVSGEELEKQEALEKLTKREKELLGLKDI